MLDDRRNAKLVDFGMPSYPNPPDLIPNNPNHSPLTTNHSPLTTHHSPLTTHRSPLTTQPTPLTFHPNPNQGAAREGAHVMLHSVQVSYLLTPRPHLNPNPNQEILIQHPDPNPN